MPLYMNTNDHPSVYKNKAEIKEPNQGYYRRDYFKQLADEQSKLHELFLESFKDLKVAYLRQEKMHHGKWNEVNKQLQILDEKTNEHEKAYSLINDGLAKLNENDQKLEQMLGSKEEQQQQVVDKINSINLSSQEIYNELETSKQQTNTQIKELYSLIKQVNEQVALQDENQHKVVSRLENQEALMEKVLRQMDYLRSVLFERASYLADKVEESYQLTSSYIYKTLTGSNQPLSLISNERKKVSSREDKVE